MKGRSLLCLSRMLLSKGEKVLVKNMKTYGSSTQQKVTRCLLYRSRREQYDRRYEVLIGYQVFTYTTSASPQKKKPPHFTYLESKTG